MLSRIPENPFARCLHVLRFDFQTGEAEANLLYSAEPTPAYTVPGIKRAVFLSLVSTPSPSGRGDKKTPLCKNAIVQKTPLFKRPILPKDTIALWGHEGNWGHEGSQSTAGRLVRYALGRPIRFRSSQSAVADQPPGGRLATLWIPACAGMTEIEQNGN